ncbi:fumarylacetoacetate hydrolase [Paenibacillus jamilae]|uniref:Fumarylacetoacetate hydrolase n=1 Tax=Paenibacillus jamilae TaxID=114136 RepID=A0ACC4ZNT7_9BACL|nr:MULTISPECIES: fumarylacetoacetate hydrolase family protein [Paenibacillus]AUO09013.1 FAA hydrolase family protein [Paenibacillus sp. lzh-N1]KTS77465.1 fumarylacetoacetate hydrolase [Paenibacillus jamilae]
MKLATAIVNGEETAAIIFSNNITTIKTINETENKNWSTDLFQLIQKGQITEMIHWYTSEGKHKLCGYPAVKVEQTDFGPLYRNPRKILGVGMNFQEKAVELSGKLPEEEPVIFMKPDTSLIGIEESIRLPTQSRIVTAEAELGIIIGRTCKNVKPEDALSVVAGFTTTLDMTAKDIHAKNPRYLQRSKSFDTFFSFGPYFITFDELEEIMDIEIETVLNGKVEHRNIVRNMMYPPEYIVSFFSQIMTLYPGDIIMTGTPGSVPIRKGDVVGCNIKPFKMLFNSVI